MTTLFDSLLSIESEMAITPDLIAKSAATYGVALRAMGRGAWNGVYGYLEFESGMWDVLRRFFSEAWYAAAASCGRSPNELTAAEVDALNTAIFTDGQHIGGLYDWIAENSKANGGLLGTVITRLEMWEARYAGVKSEGLALLCGDQKLEWTLNPLKENCSSCLQLNGKIYRASVWYEHGLIPRSRALECKGYRCGCELKITDKPGTPGRPPRIG